jgi:hypothetical protein
MKTDALINLEHAKLAFRNISWIKILSNAFPAAGMIYA